MKIENDYTKYYIKWGFESRLKHNSVASAGDAIISNGDLKVG